MPIRHLTLTEPQYVPSYNTLDLSLVNTVDSQIQHQGMLAQEQSSGLFQNLQEEVLSNLSGLPEEFQTEAAGLIDQSRANIDRIFEEKGARHALPAIQREAQKATSALRPYQQVAGQAQAYKEKIDQAKEVDPTVRAWARQQGNVVRDEDGNLSFQGISLDVFDNWQNIPTVIQDFLKQANADISQSGLISIDGFDNTILGSMTREILDGDILLSNVVGRIFSDDQLIQQIGMSLQAQGIDPNANAQFPKHVEIRHPETGEILQQEESRMLNNLHAEVIRMAAPHVDLVSYEKRTMSYRNNPLALKALDNSLPPLIDEMIIGNTEARISTPNKLYEEVTNHRIALDELKKEYDSEENPYVKINIQGRIDALQKDIDSVLDLQNRALANAGISHEEIINALSNLPSGALVEYEPGLFGRGAPYISNQTNYESLIEDFEKTGVITPSIVSALQKYTSLPMSTYEEILKTQAEPYATHVPVFGFTDRRTREMVASFLNNSFSPNKDLSSRDFQWWSSSSTKSIFESKEVENIAKIDTNSAQMSVFDGQIYLVTMALDANDTPIGRIATKAPQNLFHHLRQEDQVLINDYISSGLDAVSRTQNRSMTMNVPVILSQQDIQRLMLSESEGGQGLSVDEISRIVREGAVTSVKVTSMLAQNEDGTISTKDTKGAHYMIEAWGDHPIPAYSKREAQIILDFIKSYNKTGLRNYLLNR